MLRITLLIWALLLATSDCLPRDFTDSYGGGGEPTFEQSEFQRVKRALTSICVEIKPSTPYEEPYLMCKGAEMPPTQKPSESQGYYRKPMYGPSRGGNFQSFPQYESYAGQKAFLDSEGFRNNYGADGSTPQYFGRGQSQDKLYPAFGAKPAFRPNSYTPDQPFGYESLFPATQQAANGSPLPTQPFTGFGARGYPSSAAGPSEKASAFPPTNREQPYSQTPAAYDQKQSLPKYSTGYPSGRDQPTADVYPTYGRQYPGGAPNAPANANTEKSPYGQGVPYAHASQAPTAKGEPQVGPAATARNPASVAATTTNPGAALMKTPTGNGRNGDPQKPTDRQNGDVLAARNWNYTPEQPERYRSQSRRDPMQPFMMPQGQVMPLEHQDDPIMRKFYDSLVESPEMPTAPAISPEAATGIVSAPLAPAQVTYQQPTAKPSYYGQSAEKLCIPKPAGACSPCAGNNPPGPTYVALQQPNLAASEADSYYMQPKQPASPCPSADYRIAPLIIAMPCLGQQGYGQNAGAMGNFGIGAQMGLRNLFPQPAYPNYGNQMSALYNQPSYDTSTQNPMVGAPNPFGPLAMLNPLHPMNPLNVFNPLNPFNAFNPMRYRAGLLGQAQPEAETPSAKSSKPKENEKTLENDSKDKIVGSPRDSLEQIQAELTPKGKNDSKKKKNDKEGEDSSQEDTNQSDEQKDKALETTVKPITLTITTDKKTNDSEAELDEQYVEPVTLSLQNMEEETKKTYDTMMNAAKTFARISKREELPGVGNEFDTDDEALGVKRLTGSATPATVYRKVYKLKANKSLGAQ